MALVKYGATVSQLSGSVGGIVYARNKGGAYIRTRTSPTQPNSTLQVAARTLFSAAVNTWTNILTPEERTQWNGYASAIPYTDVFGETRYYSGQQRYVQCYVALVNSGGSPAAAAIAPAVFTAAEAISSDAITVNQGAVAAGTTVSVVNTTGPLDVAAGDKLLIHIGGPITAAKNYFNGPWRYAASGVYVSGGNYPDILATDPWARSLASGSPLALYWRVLKADNRISSVARKIVTLGAYVTP